MMMKKKYVLAYPIFQTTPKTASVKRHAFANRARQKEKQCGRKRNVLARGADEKANVGGLAESLGAGSVDGCDDPNEKEDPEDSSKCIPDCVSFEDFDGCQGGHPSIMKACEWFPEDPLEKDPDIQQENGRCDDRVTCLNDMLVKIESTIEVGPQRFGLWVEMAPTINQRIVIHIQDICVYQGGGLKKEKVPTAWPLV
eukprot:TRINITY_DN382_c0_g1_i1.p1 TRINITY_DN382_c0_g1~~TRINITY_DN382_c0_g1_i1.p1  ORF type:complete len:198 (+),score=43.89 TRINITY_DN382_c0_g1_i1:745-1338(+)